MKATIRTPKTSTWIPEKVDVAIVTAMDDELHPILNLLPWWTRFTIDNFPHYFGRLPIEGASVRAVACSLWKYGSSPTVSAVNRLHHLAPRLFVMTGICAGSQKMGIELGDVIVADRAFNPDEGKQTSAGMKHETLPIGPKPWLVKQLHSIAKHEAWMKSISVAKPQSLRFLGDVMLCQMHNNPQPFRENTSVLSELGRRNLTDGLEILKWLEESGYLDGNGRLSAKGRDRLSDIRISSAGAFTPLPDRTKPKVHYGSFASRQSVVAIDRPFDEYQQRIRSTSAIEMEVAALYHAVNEFEGAQAIAVKGVSDYGTEVKDDRFREYAAEVSARWALGFLRLKWAEIETSLIPATARHEVRATSPKGRRLTRPRAATKRKAADLATIRKVIQRTVAIPHHVEMLLSKVQAQNASQSELIAPIQRSLLSEMDPASKRMIVLVQTAQEVETVLEVARVATLTRVTSVPTPIGACYDLGTIGRCHPILFQLRLDSPYAKETLSTLLMASRAIVPYAIIFLGQGKKRSTTNSRGTRVLISESILRLEPRTERNRTKQTDFSYIEHCISTPRQFLEVFRTYATFDAETKVLFGPILATSQVNLERHHDLSSLMTASSSAVGLELENLGYYALQNLKINWVSVLGIGQENDGQARMGGNIARSAVYCAARFLFNVLGHEQRWPA